MNEDIGSLVAKSERNLRQAFRIHEDGSHDIAVSRAYYAMFYIASAALLLRGLTFKKHSGLIAAFSQRLTRPGDLPARLHLYLLDAFDERTRGDYRLFDEVTHDEALEQLKHAEEFVGIVRAFLEKESQP